MTWEEEQEIKAAKYRRNAQIWWTVGIIGAIIFLFLMGLMIVTVEGGDRRMDECMDPKIHRYLMAHFEFKEAWHLASLECA